MPATTHLRLAALAAVAVLATAAPAAAGSYGWPVKPFDRQHPVRGFFGDPRIGVDHGRLSRQLHFGIDVSAPNGAPVYATISGRIFLHPLHPDVVEVQAGGTTFEYWHIRPAVASGSAVAYRTVLGHVEAPWAHVHFSERHGATYVNPLRPGALAPYRDTTRPLVRSIGFERDGAGLGRVGLSGPVDLVAEAYDETPLPVPAPWDAKPVAPALVEWRIGTSGAWRCAVDFRDALPTASFEGVYARWTRQNVASRPGRYRFLLARGLDIGSLGAGAHVLQVRVADTGGHASVASARFSVFER